MSAFPWVVLGVCAAGFLWYGLWLAWYEREPMMGVALVVSVLAVSAFITLAGIAAVRLFT